MREYRVYLKYAAPASVTCESHAEARTMVEELLHQNDSSDYIIGVVELTEYDRTPHAPGYEE